MKKLLTLLGLALGLTISPNLSQAQETTPPATPKILIAYYSYSGNTAQAAKAIQQKIGGDLFAITSDHTYPQDYHEMVQQAKEEIAQNFRPRLTSSVKDIAQYDIVFIGSPNWWGTIAPQVSSFLEQYNLSGKTVIPFITHGGGGLQNTVSDLTAQCKGCQIKPSWDGYQTSLQGLDDWLKSLNL